MLIRPLTKTKELASSGVQRQLLFPPALLQSRPLSGLLAALEGEHLLQLAGDIPRRPR